MRGATQSAADMDEAWRPIRLTIGVTAHRDIPTAEVPGIQIIVGQLFDDLARRFPGTPLRALCPLAEGGERIFARAARERGIPLVVPLPLSRDQYLEDFGDAASRTEFEQLCSEAEVFELPLQTGVSLQQVTQPGPWRDSAYARLGVFVASHAQILVAIWDGKNSDQVGGTAQIVRYRLFGAYPETPAPEGSGGESVGNDENDITFHIACSRDRADGAPAAPLAPLQTRWLTGDGSSPPSHELPCSYADIFDMTAEFNHDCRKAGAAAGLPGSLLAPTAQKWPASMQHIDAMFAIANRLANHFQSRLNFALRATYVLAVLMGGAFVGYSTVPGQQPLLYGFLGLFALGFCIYAVARRGDWHRKYLDYRVLAEGLRVQCFWTAAGIKGPDDGRFPYENFLQQQDPELGWIRHVMRDIELRAQPPGDAGGTGLRYVIGQWVGAATGAPAGQLGYYRNKGELRYRLNRLTDQLAALCLWSGMAIAVALALLAGHVSHGIRTAMLLLLGLLPLIAAVRQAYSYKRGDRELIKQYRFMAKTFAGARRRLDAASSAREQRNVLRALGVAALEEHAEWILIHRERPLEHTRF